MDVDKERQKKIMKEIEDLTPYTAELQEFKQRGLFVPPGTAGAKRPRPIFDANGKRIDSAKRKSAPPKEKELRDKFMKMRVLKINQWLDERFTELFPKWAMWLLRRYPRLRPFMLRVFFTKVEISRSNIPKPFGADLVRIICFWSKYAEVRFVWEK